MNDTTFQGDGKVAYVPVVVNAKLKKPLTNADRIRAMSDEELAKLLDHDCPPRSALDVCPQYESGKPYTQEGCYQCRLAWLKQEASNAL